MSQDSDSQAIFDAVQNLRKSRGLSLQIRDRKLEVESFNYATSMARRGVLQHDPNVFDTSAQAEIIASREPGKVTDCVDQWLGSPPHRRIMLGNYSYVGYAAATIDNDRDETKEWYYVGRASNERSNDGIPIPDDEIPPKPLPPKPQPPQKSWLQILLDFLRGRI